MKQEPITIRQEMTNTGTQIHIQTGRETQTQLVSHLRGWNTLMWGSQDNKGKQESNTDAITIIT